MYVVPGIWREIINFSSGAICLVLASEVYQKDDYIRDYQDFLELEGPLRYKTILSKVPFSRYGQYFRLVEEEDYEFIFQLRSDK